MAFLSFLIVVALVVCHNPKQLPEEKSEELPVFNLEAVAGGNRTKCVYVE